MKIAQNKKAFFDYQILEKFQAGIVLLGHEVKSIRQGRISLKEGYVRIKNGEVFLENTHIAPYQLNIRNYNPKKPRKLLLQKREIDFLQGKVKSGLTIIPLAVLLKNN